MMAELVRDILGIYRKHGWTAERLLLSEAGAETLGDLRAELFAEVEVIPAEFDAVWFGRPSKKGKKALELRLISAEPFAVFDLVDEDADENEVQAVIERMEKKAAERASNAFPKTRSH